MCKDILKNRLLVFGFFLNALVSIVLPLFALLIFHFFPYSTVSVLTNLFGYTILAAMAVSMVLKNRFLYILNIFSCVLFLNVFIQSHFSAQFIHIDYVIYAISTVTLFLVAFKHAVFSKMIKPFSELSDDL